MRSLAMIGIAIAQNMFDPASTHLLVTLQMPRIEIRAIGEYALQLDPAVDPAAAIPPTL